MPLRKKTSSKRPATPRERESNWLSKEEAALATSVFLPGMLPQVRAIAWRGATDTEIAQTFGVSPTLLEKWKLQYPSFRDAIENGRTHADSMVVESLFKECVGYDYHEQMVAGRNATIKEIRRRARPNGDLIKFWLTNRQREYWSSRTSLDGGSSGDRSNGGTKPIESRVDLINSILNLVQPKPDPEAPNE